MRRRTFIVGTFSAGLLPMPVLALRPATTVAVFASMHGRMATSATFTYNDLYRAVAAFLPNRVGVDIRQEDLGAADAYLHNYPREMLRSPCNMAAAPSASTGWEELVGRPIPDDWFTVRRPIKHLERSWTDDAIPSDRWRQAVARRLQRLFEEQDHLLNAATVRTLADGRYDRVTAEYYDTMSRLTAGTRFHELVDWYRERDGWICRHILDAVRSRPGERVAIVTGGDHHSPVTTALQRHVGVSS